MALSITFYNTASNPKDVPKVLGTALGQALTLNPYKALDELTGTIIVDYNATWLTANYCIMEGKSYFITDREYDIGQKMKLTLKVDVLETYWSQIQNCPAVYDRSDCFPNDLLDDGMERVSVKRDVEYIGFMIPGKTVAETIDDPPLNYPDKVLTIVML